MSKFVSVLCSLLLVFPNFLFAGALLGPQSGAQARAVSAPTKQPVLEDGTPVKLRISQTVSSASAHVGDRVQFEVLEEIKVGSTVVIPKGGIAWGTVTEAQPKRRLGRAGKLEIVMDSVRLSDGEKAALRATKEVKGGSHTAAMTVGIVATGLILWPAAPFFLFMHGKDITIPKGTEVPTFVNGDFPIDLAKFQTPGSAVQVASNGPAAAGAKITVTSVPNGADILVDGNFVGDTPSTVSVSAGDHMITVHKDGYKDWARKLAVTSGNLNIDADLETVAGPAAKTQQPK
jgi:hypothetical protein